MKNFNANNAGYTNDRKTKNKYYVKILLVIVFLVAIISGVSYAFYTLTVGGNKKVEMTAGTFNIQFTDGNAVNISQGIPMTDNEGLADNDNITTFSITNTGDIAASYSIALEEVDIDSNTMDKKWIKYSLREKDGDWSTPQSLSNGLLLRNNLYLEPGETVNYELKIWLAYEAPNDIQGKKFSAKVVVNAIQSNAKLSNTTQPIINIANTSINVIKGDTLYRDPIPYEVVDAHKNEIDLGKVEKTYEYFDGETIKSVNSVDVNNTGIYYIYYRVTDNNGNIGCTVVSINVCEENNGSVPVITLNGPDTVEINKGSKYVDDGAFAVDDEDGELKVITIGEVNTNVVGEYIIRYIAKDSKNNLVSVIKTVRVIDNDKEDDDDFTIKIGTIAINSEDDNKIDIPVTVKSTDTNKVKVILNENSNQPSVEDFNDVEETSDFDHIFNVTSNGTYYVWVLDSNNNIKSKKVVVDVKEEEPKPDSKPVCRFTGDKYMTIDKDADNNTIDLICTDEHQEINEKYLSNNDFQIGDSSILEISEISGYAKVDNGYKYTITLNSLKAGDTTITLKDGVISNINNKSNDSVSTNVYVRVLEIDDEYKNLKMNSGDTKEITVKNSVGDLEYVSSNEEVASVDANGVITTNAVGTATIKVTDTVTKSKVEFNVDVVKKITVEYIKNGRNVDSIEELKSENTTCELNSEHLDSCEVTLPEFTTTNGYKTVGWSTSSTDHSGTKIGEKFSVSEDTTLYTISSKKGKTYEISWNSNGVNFSEAGSTSCSVDSVYNDEEYNEDYSDSCFVKKPKIEANENVTIVGYNTDKNAHESITNVDDDLELNSSNNGEVYYTISYKNPITYTANFNENGYEVNVGEVEDNTCTIEKVWNNDIQGTSCNVKTPEVTVPDGYSFVGWNTSNDATDIVNNGNMVTISGNTDFYTITKFDEKSISARFASQGIGVSEISSNIQQCIIPEQYNPKEKVDNICILDKTKIPTIGIAEENLDKYEVIGWNEDPTATVKSESYTEGGDLRITEDITYYTITKRKETILTAKWDKNGAELHGNDDNYSEEESISKCTIPAVYNETEENRQSSNCSVVAPTIIREGFIIDGYIDNNNEDASVSFNSNDTIVLTNDKNKDTGAIETGKTWKAKTHKTINVIWHTNGAKLKQGDSDSEKDITSECTIMNKDTTCSITSPEIVRSGYNIIGYNTDNNANESVWTHKEMKSVSENQEYYAITSKDVTVSFYYNNNGSVDVIEDTQTLWNTDLYRYNVPEVVTNSKGPRGLSYSAVSSDLNSTVPAESSNNIKSNTKYYAIYGGDVDTNIYYYNLHEGDDFTDATQEVETVSTNISAVIKESNDSTYTVNNENVNIPSVVSTSEGPGGGVDASAVRKYIGLSRNSSSKVIEKNITTENDNYYAVYKGIWKVRYSYDNSSINNVGAEIASCDVYGLTNGSIYSENGENTKGIEGSCITTLPDVNLKTGYNTPKWYDDETAVGSPNEEYTITGFKTLNAKASINTYIVTYDCNTNGGVCHVSGQDTVEHNGLADLGGIGEKEGYDFLGWNTDKDADAGLTEAPRVTKDMTLYAIFKKTTSISLNSKTASYTGSSIEANKAIVADGDESDISYTYYTDNKCSTEVSIETGASSTGKAPVDAGTYYVKATTTSANGKKVSSNCVLHTITPKEINVTWDEQEYTYNGKKQAPTYATSGEIDGETITYTQSEANDKNQIDANGVGESYTAKLSIKSVSGGREKASNYQLINNTKDYVINPGVGYVNLDSESGTAIYGDNNKSFVVTGTHGGELSAVEIENEAGQKSGVSISINSKNNSGTTSSNNTITIGNLKALSAGTKIKIKVTSLATNNYTSGSKTYTLTINKKDATCPSTITPYNGEYDGKEHSITIGNYTGGKIQYSTDDGATWQDDMPKRIEVGSTKVYIRVYGDSNHNTSLCGHETINVTSGSNPAEVKAVSNLVYGSNANMVTTKGAIGLVYYSTTTKLTSENYTEGSTTIPIASTDYNVNEVENKEVNGKKIKNTVYYYALGNKNYSAAQGEVPITINKANAINPKLTAYSGDYDGNAHSITVSGGSGGTIMYSTDNKNWLTTKPTYTDFTNGNKTTYVKVVGDKNHYDTTVISSTVTITKATPKINVLGVSGLKYNDNKNMITVNGVPNGVNMYYSTTTELKSTNYTSGSTTIPTNTNIEPSDKYKVYYYVDGGQNYNSVANSVIVTISKRDNDISVTANSLQYKKEANLVSTSNAQGTVYYSVGTALTSNNYSSAGSTTIPTTCTSGSNSYSYSDCVFRDAGDYTVYYYATGDATHKAKSDSIKVTINKKENTLIVSPKTGLNYGVTSNMVTVSDKQGEVYYRVEDSLDVTEYSLDETNYRTEGSTTIPTTCTEDAYSKKNKCLSGGSHTIFFYTPGNKNYAAKKGYTRVTIAKQTGYVNLSKTSDSMYFGADSYSFNISSHHGGKLQVSSNNSTVYGSLSGNTVTISNLTNVSQGTTIAVTVTSAETDAYKSASNTFRLTVNPLTRKATFGYDADSGITGVTSTTKSCQTSGTSLTCSVYSPSVTKKTGYSFNYWMYGRGYTSTSETGLKEMSGDTTFTAYGKDTEGPVVSYNSNGSTTGTKYTKTSYNLYYNLTVKDNSNNYNSSAYKNADVHIGGSYLGSYQLNATCGGGICNYTIAIPISSSNTRTGAVTVTILAGTFKDLSGNSSSSLTFNPGTTFKKKQSYYY